MRRQQRVGDTYLTKFLWVLADSAPQFQRFAEACEERFTSDDKGAQADRMSRGISQIGERVIDDFIQMLIREALAIPSQAGSSPSGGRLESIPITCG